jgi:hypothetical protein
MMLKKLVGTFAVAAALAVPTVEASAQLKKGYTDIGAVVGIGGLNGAGLSFGGRFERVIKELPSLGNGTLGINIGVDYYSWDDGFIGYNYSYTFIPISGTANYHFKLSDPKWDAFIGAGLVYNVIDCGYTGTFGGIDLCDGLSSLEVAGRIGGRYFAKPNLALYADAGAGGATLKVGVMFKLR